MSTSRIAVRAGAGGHRELSAFGWSLHGAGLAVTAVAAVAVIAIVIRPLRAEGRRVKAEILSAGNYLQQREQIESRHEHLHSTLSEQQQLHADLLAQIPAMPRESEFLAQLTELSRSTGMAISGYNPGETEQHSSHAALAIKLKARASHESLCRFLTGLETLPRLCHVTHLHVVTPKIAEAVYPVEMTVKIFFSPVTDPEISEDQRG